MYPYQYGDPDDAELSAYGQQLWDELINDNDQIFLTLNGHYWPPGRTTLTERRPATTCTCTSPTTRTATTAARR